MSKEIEVIKTQDGVVSFDHNTGVMSAVWFNGYHETWPTRGYSVDTLYAAFLWFTNQMERYIEVTGETEWL